MILLKKPAAFLPSQVDDEPQRQATPTTYRELLLLDGSPYPTDLRAAIGRSLLDLPVEAGRTLLMLWRDHAMALADTATTNRFPLRVLTDQAAMLPSPLHDNPAVPIYLQRDPAPLRGTGGLLRDATAACRPHEQFLVASAAQILLEPLANLASSLAATGGDVALISQPHDLPVPFFAIRCDCLRLIPEVGFIDLKEQALPLIAKRHAVRSLHRHHPVSLPIRTLTQYIHALHWHHRLKRSSTPFDPFSEDGQSTFAIEEEGSIVEPTARLVNAVVLRGGRVDRNAIVVRSVVCPGAHVQPGEVAVDRLITGST